MHINNLLAFMATAARTAPKSKGFDDLTIKAEKNNLILGINAKKPPKVNCGLCGCIDCNGFIKCLSQGKNVNCIFKILDLAIAIGSSSYTAEKLGFDVLIEYLENQKVDSPITFNIKIKGKKVKKEISEKTIDNLEDIDKKTIDLVIDIIEKKMAGSNLKKSQISTKHIKKNELKKFTQEINPNLFLKDKKYEKLDKKEKKYLWFIDSDREVLEKSDGVFALGIKAGIPEGINCGLCGCEDCSDFIKELNNKNVNCTFRIIDLGMLIGKAAGILADYRIDNRIFYSVGEAIRKKEFKDSNLVIGIGLSVKGNNIFFDRYLKHFLDKSRQSNKKIDEILDAQGIA